MQTKRTTQNLGAWVSPATKERAERAARTRGQTLSAYVTALIGIEPMEVAAPLHPWLMRGLNAIERHRCDGLPLADVRAALDDLLRELRKACDKVARAREPLTVDEGWTG